MSITDTQRRSSRLILAGFALVFVTGASHADSTLPYFSGTLDSFKGFHGPATLEIYEYVLAPDETTGWHYHVGATYVIVQSGTVLEDRGCGRTRQLTGGEAFQEPSGAIHNVTNTSAVAPVVLWVTQIYPIDSVDFFPVDIPLTFKHSKECLKFFDNQK